MGPLGVQEMIFIFVLALLVFGPKKLPELGRTFGKGMAEFRRASNELKSTFQTEMDNIERETKLKETASEIKTEVNKQISSNYYDDSEDDYYKYDDTPSDSGASASKTKAASSTVETSTSPAVNGDSSVASSNGQSAPAVASNEPKQAESSANAGSETKAS